MLKKYRKNRNTLALTYPLMPDVPDGSVSVTEFAVVVWGEDKPFIKNPLGDSHIYKSALVVVATAVL